MGKIEVKVTINPLDQLRILLKEADIPYTDIKVRWSKEQLESYASFPMGPKDMNEFQRNQLIYGIDIPGEKWKFDAIYHFGAHSDHQFLECWGTLIGDEPRSITVREAFKIISEDWEKCNGKS